MKSKLFLTLCSVAILPIILFAQTSEEIVIDKFTGIFLGVSGVVFFALTWLATKVPFIAKLANLKLVSAIVSAVIALVGVFIAGLPPLTIGAAFSLITFLYNFVRGWIDTNKGETIEAKKTVQFVASPEQTALKSAKFRNN